jgi:hypothetical protein
MQTHRDNYKRAIRYWFSNNYQHFFDLTIAGAQSYDAACAEILGQVSLREIEPATFDAVVAECLETERLEVPYEI